MADIVTSQIFTDGERGITATKMNNIVAGSAIQPAFYSAKPTSSTLVAGDKLLVLKGGTGAYAQSDFQNVIDSVSAGINSDAEIWSVRLRSFNSIGNPNFEVDQRNCFAGLANPAGGTFIQDRWISAKAASTTAAGNWNPLTGGIVIPGTSYWITKEILRFVLSTQQASLASADTLGLIQQVEGSCNREIIGDVSSLSLFVRSSVANLKFAISIRDFPPTYSVVNLCTLGAANTFQLIQIPNIPKMYGSGGGFTYNPGQIGYTFGLFLASGSTVTAPAAGTWQAGNFVGAPGMSNFAASPVNSTFDIAFVQHEPGPVCSTFMDKPFSQNLDECLRYYQKSYDYLTVAGTATTVGARVLLSPTQTFAYGSTPFHKPMAKIPAMILYNASTGTAGSVRDGNAVDHASAIAQNMGQSGFPWINFATATTGLLPVTMHYTADTGW